MIFALFLMVLGLIVMGFTILGVWIVFPLMVAMVVKLFDKVRRGSEDGIY